MMMCSNLPGSLLKPTLALMLLLRAVRSQYADYCGGLVSWTSAKLDYRVVLRIRNLPSRRLYLFNPVTTYKDLRRLVSGKIREELISQTGLLSVASQVPTVEFCFNFRSGVFKYIHVLSRKFRTENFVKQIQNTVHSYVCAGVVDNLRFTACADQTVRPQFCQVLGYSRLAYGHF
jgi:hypothetical protein